MPGYPHAHTPNIPAKSSQGAACSWTTVIPSVIKAALLDEVDEHLYVMRHSSISVLGKIQIQKEYYRQYQGQVSALQRCFHRDLHGCLLSIWKLRILCWVWKQVNFQMTSFHAGQKQSPLSTQDQHCRAQSQLACSRCPLSAGWIQPLLSAYPYKTNETKIKRKWQSLKSSPWHKGGRELVAKATSENDTVDFHYSSGSCKNRRSKKHY